MTQRKKSGGASSPHTTTHGSRKREKFPSEEKRGKGLPLERAGRRSWSSTKKKSLLIPTSERETAGGRKNRPFATKKSPYPGYDERVSATSQLQGERFPRGWLKSLPDARGTSFLKEGVAKRRRGTGLCSVVSDKGPNPSEGEKDADKRRSREVRRTLQSA